MTGSLTIFAICFSNKFTIFSVTKIQHPRQMTEIRTDCVNIDDTLHIELDWFSLLSAEGLAAFLYLLPIRLHITAAPVSILSLDTERTHYVRCVTALLQSVSFFCSLAVSVLASSCAI